MFLAGSDVVVNHVVVPKHYDYMPEPTAPRVIALLPRFKYAVRRLGLDEMYDAGPSNQAIRWPNLAGREQLFGHSAVVHDAFR